MDRHLVVLGRLEGDFVFNAVGAVNKAFACRGHARQGQWRQAGEDLRVCILMVDRETHVDAAAVATLLANYAITLRKNHRKGEARSIEARASALRDHPATNAVVDVTELLAESKLHNK